MPKWYILLIYFSVGGVLILRSNSTQIKETITNEGFATVCAEVNGKVVYYTIGAQVFTGCEFYIEHMDSRTVEKIIIHLMEIFSKQPSEDIPLAFSVTGLLAHAYQLGLMVIDDSEVIKESMPAMVQYQNGSAGRVYQILPPDIHNRLPWDLSYDADSLPSQSVINERFLRDLRDRSDLIPNLEVQSPGTSKTLH